MKNFISCHCHVQSLDSASTPEEFVKRELELGTGAITVTDHGSLGACQKVYELAKKNNLIPILGLESYFKDSDCKILSSSGKPSDYLKYQHATVHFLDQPAFMTGIKLLSRAPLERHGQESKPLFNWENLEELGAQNTTIGSSCLVGMVQRFLLDRQDPETAIKYYEKLRSIVKPGNWVVEIFPHDCSMNFIKGVFLTLQEADGTETKLKYYEGKTVKTNVGELKVVELAKAFNKKNNEHAELLAVKDRSTWNDRLPAKIIKVEHIEGSFIANECGPYAPDGDVQLGANRFMLELANKYGDPILVSDDSHHAYADEKILQNVRLSQSGWGPFYGNYARQSSEEAFSYFKAKMGISLKTFEGWVDNSQNWASKFKDFKLETKPSLPVKFYETKYPEVNARNSFEYTIALIKKHGRMDWDNPEYVARLQQEFELLLKNGTIDLLPYWMPFEEICELYQEKGELPGCGRGSACGVLLSYLLDITHADPIKYQLSLDRFLTLDRIASGSFPDLDQDLPSRDLLVDPENGYLKRRFGDHFAQISTDTTLKLKSAILDVARFTYGSVPYNISELTKKMEIPPQGLDDHKFVFGYEDADSRVQGSIERDPALIKYVSEYPEQWKIVQKALGLSRNKGRHASAYILANQPVGDFIPLTKIKDVVCTQFTASSVEAMGGLKMDFLVVLSLNDISNTIKLIQKRNSIEKAKGEYVNGKWVPFVRLLPHRGESYDIWDLPVDQEVYKDIAGGKTETVYQLNTGSAKKWLKNFSYKRPGGKYIINSIEDIAVFTALDRPGPLDAFVKDPESGKEHNMLVEYARRARGEDPVHSLKEWEDLFPDTLGICVFQESLQYAYQKLMGCSGAEAEAFRRAVGKKNKEKIIAAYPKFEKIVGEKYGKEKAQKLYSLIQSWSEYGFCKAHAIGVSATAYACAFLKHHYPLEWWCSVLQNASKEEITEEFWKHCGHLVDLPNLTKAYSNFEIVNDRIQAPLSLLHGVGEGAQKELVAGAPYTNIADFINKIEQRKIKGTAEKLVKKKVKDEEGNTTETEVLKTVKGRSALNKGIIYKLIISGAMDSLFPQGISTLEMLNLYETEVWNLENANRAARLPKPKRPKKAPDSVDPAYINLTQYTRYQLRKEILPAFSDNLFKMMVERRHPSVVNNKYYRSDNCRFEDANGVNRKLEADLPEGERFTIAVAGYVEAVRVFNYGENKEKTACDITLDLNGTRLKFVKWPDRNTNELDTRFGEFLKGSLVVLKLVKFRNNKPFSIDDIEIVQSPPQDPKEEEGSS